MNKLSLAEAKKSHPVALYSFMRITHTGRVMESFFKNPTVNPTLTYKDTLTAAQARRRLNAIEAKLEHAQDPQVVDFLNHRLHEAKILCQFTELREGAASDAQLAQYRADMVELYGPINTRDFNGVLTYLHALAQAKDDHDALEVLARVDWKPASLPTPSAEAFVRYRRMLKRHMPKMFKPVDNAIDAATAIQSALEAEGLAAAGWRVRRMPHATNVAVSRHGKSINVGEQYQPGTPFRLQQIIAHEVYGHARRFDLSGSTAGGYEEEGLAIALEQLLASRFMYKRMLRYLAVCLAWGVDNVPRDFVATYHSMVPLVGVVTGKSGLAAQETAFKETLRAFRGGIPTVPGMVLTKDKVYLESNLMVWQYLTDNMLDEAAFGRLIDGHDSIPERNSIA